MKYVHSHDLSHTKTTEWIILDVRQSYFSLYFTVVVTIVDRPCDSMVICSAAFKMLIKKSTTFLFFYLKIIKLQPKI